MCFCEVNIRIVPDLWALSWGIRKVNIEDRTHHQDNTLQTVYWTPAVGLWKTITHAGEYTFLCFHHLLFEMLEHFHFEMLMWRRVAHPSSPPTVASCLDMPSWVWYEYECEINISAEWWHPLDMWMFALWSSFSMGSCRRPHAVCLLNLLVLGLSGGGRFVDINI